MTVNQIAVLFGAEILTEHEAIQLVRWARWNASRPRVRLTQIPLSKALWPDLLLTNVFREAARGGPSPQPLAMRKCA